MGKKRKEIKINKDSAEGIMAVAKAAALIVTVVYTLKGGLPTSMSKAKDVADATVKAGAVAKTAGIGKEIVKDAATNVQKGKR